LYFTQLLCSAFVTGNEEKGEKDNINKNESSKISTMLENCLEMKIDEKLLDVSPNFISNVSYMTNLEVNTLSFIWYLSTSRFIRDGTSFIK
jgi:hypothetical protein